MQPGHEALPGLVADQGHHRQLVQRRRPPPASRCSRRRSERKTPLPAVPAKRVRSALVARREPEGVDGEVGQALVRRLARRRRGRSERKTPWSSVPTKTVPSSAKVGRDGHRLHRVCVQPARHGAPGPGAVGGAVEAVGGEAEGRLVLGEGRGEGQGQHREVVDPEVGRRPGAPAVGRAVDALGLGAGEDGALLRELRGEGQGGDGLGALPELDRAPRLAPVGAAHARRCRGCRRRGCGPWRSGARRPGPGCRGWSGRRSWPARSGPRRPSGSSRRWRRRRRRGRPAPGRGQRQHGAPPTEQRGDHLPASGRRRGRGPALAVAPAAARSGKRDDLVYVRCRHGVPCLLRLLPVCQAGAPAIRG